MFLRDENLFFAVSDCILRLDGQCYVTKNKVIL